MMHLCGLVLFLWFFLGAARRSTRINNYRSDVQQHNTLANRLQVSAQARDAFLPSGLGGIFHRRSTRINNYRSDHLATRVGVNRFPLDSSRIRNHVCSLARGDNTRNPNQPVMVSQAKNSGDGDGDVLAADVESEKEAISAADAFAQLREENPPTLLDIRTPGEYCTARPRGAVSVPAGVRSQLGFAFCFREEEFKADVRARFDHEQQLLLICEVGVISRIAAARLREDGFKSVRYVRGGFESWTSEGMSVDEGRPEGCEWKDVEIDDFDELTNEQLEERRLRQDKVDPLWPEHFQPRPYGVIPESQEEGDSLQSSSDQNLADTPDLSLDDVFLSLAEDPASVEMPQKTDASAAPTLAPDDIAPSPSSHDDSRRDLDQPKSSGLPKKLPAWFVSVSNVDFAGLWANGQLGKLTVKELKSFLLEKGMQTTGQKDELTARVAEYIEKASN